MTRNVGTNGIPTPATGVPMTFGSDFTNGATGRGTAGINGGSQKQQAIGAGGNVRYRFDNGDWNAQVGLSLNKTRRFDYDAKADRMFNGTTITLRTPVRISFGEIKPDGPGTTRAYDNNNQEVDLLDLNNYIMTAGTDGSYFYRTGVESVDFSARRTLGWLSFPATLQVGGVWSHQWMNGRRTSNTYTYNGPDGNPATPDSPAPYHSRIFMQRANPFGIANNIPWVGVKSIYAAWEANPNLFTQTLAQQVTAETSRIQNSLYIDETISAAYIQGEFKLLDNRLNVLTGVRYERTVDDGMGPLNDPNAVYVRNADGTLARTSAGALMRKPEAGAVGSMEQLRLVWQERAAHGRGVFTDYFPSVHLTYNITDNFLARAAYAFTYGRPNFGDIIANTTIQERTDLVGGADDPNEVPGTITVTNPNLVPWAADNYDLSLEYYTKQGGVFGAGLFRKEVKNFFGTVIRPATNLDLTEAELDPSLYDVTGWTVSTTINTVPSTVNGFEVSMNHSLRPLDPWVGGWGRYFNLFANVTKLQITGAGSAGLAGFLPLGVNAGLRFNKKPFMLSVNANYRDEETTSVPTNLGPNGRIYRPARTHIDMAVAVNLRRNLDLFFNVRNLFDEPVQTYRSSDVYPEYAAWNGNTKFGAVFNAGIRGSF